MRIKWKLFLPTWLVIVLLAPSIFLPQAFLMTRSSPDAPGLPLIMPFGAIHWANNWGFLIGRAISTGEIKWALDFLLTYTICLVPILIYTFVIALVIHQLLIRLLINKRHGIWFGRVKKPAQSE